MIIRCPHCEHTRSINESKIPASAELARCPRCKNRFRFRTVEKPSQEPQAPPPLRPAPQQEYRPQTAQPPAGTGTPPPPEAQRKIAVPPPPSPESEHPAAPVQRIQRPQSAFRETAEQNDIWDAVDALHHKWEKQMDLHVTEVVTPRVSAQSAHAQPPAYHDPRGTRQDYGYPEVEESHHGQNVSYGQHPAGNGYGEERVPQYHEQSSPAFVPHQSRQQYEQPEDGAAPYYGQQSESAYMTHQRQAYEQPQAQQQPPYYEQQTQPYMTHQSYGQLDTASQPARPRQRVASPPVDEQEYAQPPAQASTYYGQHGQTPEDVVEQDMRMMRTGTAAQRPYKDLGTLREHTATMTAAASYEAQQQADPAQGPYDYNFDAHGPGEYGENTIPWENAAAHGRFKAFLSTIYLVMFRAPSLFSQFTPYGSLAPGYVFFLIMGFFAILTSLLWGKVVAAILPEQAIVLSNQISIPSLLVIIPLALGLMLLFVAGAIRVQLNFLSPGRADFVMAYKIAAYSMAPFILSIVPFVGPTIGVVWFVFCLMLGCRHAFRLSWGLSVFIPLLPSSLLFGALAWYFI